MVAVSVLAGGCAARCPEPAAPAVARADVPTAVDPAAPLCWEVIASRQAVRGLRCRVIGVYMTRVFYAKGSSVIDAWPMVHPEDGEAVMLESLWMRDAKHDPGTIARYMGKVVEVYGEFNDVPPSHGGQNYVYQPCLSPVYAIRVVADRPAE